MPLVTRALDGGRQVVASADQAALSLGLAPGLSLAEARARVPELRVHEADPEGDAAALRHLATWASRYAPLVAPDPPDGLLLDMTGGTHLHGGEAALLDDLLERLGRSGLTVRAAMASTIGVAHALARFGPADREVVAPGDEVSRLADLSPSALRIAPDIVRGLLVLGFETVGQLMRVPRAPLARRFGPELLARLDAALGRRFEPLEPWFAPEAIQHRLAFVEPLLTATALGIALDRLLSIVCPALEAAGMGARTVDALFERVDATVQAVRIGTARPSRDPGHLGRMLRDRLERVEPGFGIEAVRLVVRVAEPLAWSQAAAVPGEAPVLDVSALVDRLGNWLGSDRVFRAVPVESRVPERSFRRAPPLWSAPNLSWPEALPRPVRLITPPQPVEAIAALPDRPPAAFTWRRVRRRIRHADGPERVTGEWWRREAEMRAVRDYWAVEDEEGRRYWLFRRGDGEDPATGDLGWFLHGLF
ncbi:Y-family DNA polymerase [Pararoseomonas baculiformis]|nr:DNA polymerase Y family protein [Pararoseomonas baculiformis]